MQARKRKPQLDIHPNPLSRGDQIKNTANTEKAGVYTMTSNRSNAGRLYPKKSRRFFFILAISWLVIVHFIERIRQKSAINKCQWKNWENWSEDQASVRPHRVAFIADPQLVDDHTYPSLPRALNFLIRKMSDNYLHINYKFLQESLGPDTTFFIGDLFDGGRDWEDGAWLEEYYRFKKIFPEYPGKTSYRGLPGNHDIGFQNVSPVRVNRFAAHFGESNAVYTLGNHTFVQLDTISLSHEDPKVHTSAREFLEQCKSSLTPSLPRFVLTHVPLYRDPSVETCGAGRESPKPFPLMRGVEYQTVIEFQFSEDILKGINPVAVFSGDDHDFCDMTHIDYSDNTKKLAREISCKTISMTNGIKRPAVQLLSLNNPLNDQGETTLTETYKTTMCYLPSPYFGVKVYFVSFLLSFGALYLLMVYSQRNTQLPFATQIDQRKPKQTFAIHCAALLAYATMLIFSYNRM